MRRAAGKIRRKPAAVSPPDAWLEEIRQKNTRDQRPVWSPAQNAYAKRVARALHARAPSVSNLRQTPFYMAATPSVEAWKLHGDTSAPPKMLAVARAHGMPTTLDAPLIVYRDDGRLDPLDEPVRPGMAFSLTKPCAEAASLQPRLTGATNIRAYELAANTTVFPVFLWEASTPQQDVDPRFANHGPGATRLSGARFRECEILAYDVAVTRATGPADFHVRPATWLDRLGWVGGSFADAAAEPSWAS